MSAHFDSNILLYADDANAGAKTEVARRLLRGAMAERTGVVSTRMVFGRRARLDRAAGDLEVSRRFLAEAEEIGREIGAGPGSPLGRELANARAALSRLPAVGRLGRSGP